MKIDEKSSLERSHQLSLQHVDDAVSPFELAAILNGNGIKYVLIGGHALSYLTGSPRATVDVDVIVNTPQVAVAVKAIASTYPHLVSKDLVYNVRFSSTRVQSHTDPERIAVVRSSNAFFQCILDKYAAPLNARGTIIHMPTAEAAIAMKFAAAISPNRGDENRPQDQADLVAIIRAHPNLNIDALTELGELIYRGGAKELQDFVASIRAGRRAVL